MDEEQTLLHPPISIGWNMSSGSDPSDLTSYKVLQKQLVEVDVLVAAATFVYDVAFQLTTDCGTIWHQKEDLDQLLEKS